jgi:hypothetical protein
MCAEICSCPPPPALVVTVPYRIDVSGNVRACFAGTKKKNIQAKGREELSSWRWIYVLPARIGFRLVFPGCARLARQLVTGYVTFKLSTVLFSPFAR